MIEIKFPKPTRPWRLVRKDEYWVFNVMKWLVSILQIMDQNLFMKNFWTTWDHTIGFPTRLTLERAQKYTDIIDHELIHIWRKEQWGGFLYSTAYIGPSITIFLPLLIISSLLHVFITYPWFWTWILLGLTMLCLPLSIGLAYGRFFIEREAYMVSIARSSNENRSEEIQRVVNTLKNNYAWTYPTKWMSSWFHVECKNLGLTV